MGTETSFEFGGVNHVALVCSDMGRTVDFYSGVLGMPLVKTVELPNGSGQHFFFDIGNGDCLAFFFFPDAPAAQPGVSAPRGYPTDLDLLSAIGSMNHLAFNVPAERFDEKVALLDAKGIEHTEVLNHDNSEWGVASEVTDDVFVRSVYFFDPDRILLELAAWTKPFTPADVAHEPIRVTGVGR
ncbi:MAG: VOC family protein [Actinobacteria bacterium]|nr:VOC family protein [Actinomycetota bacterium]